MLATPARKKRKMHCISLTSYDMQDIVKLIRMKMKNEYCAEETVATR